MEGELNDTAGTCFVDLRSTSMLGEQTTKFLSDCNPHKIVFGMHTIERIPVLDREVRVLSRFIVN